MSVVYLRKVNGGLIPFEDGDWEEFHKWNRNDFLKAEITRPRNYKFLQKFFVLISYGFECWETPEVNWEGNVAFANFRARNMPAPEKNRERFRKDVTIACGYYDLVINIKGEVRAEAKSISFASMDEDEFESLFNKAINYLIRMQILRNQTNAEVRAVVEERVNNLLAFG